MASCWSQGWELELYSANAWYQRPLYQHLQVTSYAASLINKLRQDSGNDFTLGIGPARLNYSAIHSIREWNLESDLYITPINKSDVPLNHLISKVQPPTTGRRRVRWSGVISSMSDDSLDVISSSDVQFHRSGHSHIPPPSRVILFKNTSWSTLPSITGWILFSVVHFSSSKDAPSHGINSSHFKLISGCLNLRHVKIKTERASRLHHHMMGQGTLGLV